MTSDVKTRSICIASCFLCQSYEPPADGQQYPPARTETGWCIPKDRPAEAYQLAQNCEPFQIDQGRLAKVKGTEGVKLVRPVTTKTTRAVPTIEVEVAPPNEEMVKAAKRYLMATADKAGYVQIHLFGLDLVSVLTAVNDRVITSHDIGAKIRYRLTKKYRDQVRQAEDLPTKDEALKELESHYSLGRLQQELQIAAIWALMLASEGKSLARDSLLLPSGIVRALKKVGVLTASDRGDEIRIGGAYRRYLGGDKLMTQYKRLIESDALVKAELGKLQSLYRQEKGGRHATQEAIVRSNERVTPKPQKRRRYQRTRDDLPEIPAAHLANFLTLLQGSCSNGTLVRSNNSLSDEAWTETVEALIAIGVIDRKAATEQQSERFIIRRVKALTNKYLS